MKVLTVSASPYLLTRLGRMNNRIIRNLIDQGHDVGAAVWHHDDTYFMPEEDGRFLFSESDGSTVCEMFPFDPHPEMSTPQLYEVMKKYQPEIVISIGDYVESDVVAAIKSMYPNLFKWVGVLTMGTHYVNPNWKDSLSYMDSAILTNERSLFSFLDLMGNEFPARYVPWGVDTSVFYPDGSPDPKGFLALNASKNSQQSNLGAFVQGIKICNIIDSCKTKGHIHTNVNDPGDLDLYNLFLMYGMEDTISVPQKFISINEGIPDDDLRKLYSSADVFIDCSVKSATAMSMLEAMACGAIPLINYTGQLAVVATLVGKGYHTVKGLSYIGENEEELAIASPVRIAESLHKLHDMKENEPETYRGEREKSIEIAKCFLQEDFLMILNKIIRQTANAKEHVLAVEDL